METSGGSEPRFAVRVVERTWAVEVERYDVGSPGRVAAERERRSFERDGIRVSDLHPCAVAGDDGTQLAGLVKVYVPITDAPPSARPFGFVLSGGRDAGRPYLAAVAFGERHPTNPLTRSVYERAHKRRHGRYPDE